LPRIIPLEFVMPPSRGSRSSARVADVVAPNDGKGSSSIMDERQEKLRLLRMRMQESSTANRRDAAAEVKRQRQTAGENKRLERKKRLAEAMEEKIDAEETGEDLERKRNWGYTIADNERWEKKLSQKASRGQFEFTDYDDSARRKYKKDMDAFKPDLVAYKAQKLSVLADATSGPSDVLTANGGSNTVTRAEEMLYRDANSFVYADHKPTDDAIDRVVQHINLDIDKRNKRSRTRKEDDGDITYINDKNKVFNKKLERYFHKYTQEIRENFERGTAL